LGYYVLLQLLRQKTSAAVGCPTNSMGIRAKVVGQATNNGDE
jgi:hypothetical protein